jgi:hypothetical protein
MISPTDTTYPVLLPSPSASELMEAYSPDVFELEFAEENTRQPAPRVSLLVLLKTFQRLGYFVKLADVPRSIRHEQRSILVTALGNRRKWIGLVF